MEASETLEYKTSAGNNAELLLGHPEDWKSYSMESSPNSVDT